MTLVVTEVGTEHGGVSSAVRLRGPLDRNALRAALDRLAGRPEIQGTTAEFEVADVRDVAGDRFAAAIRAAEAEATRPFDGGAVWRVLLVVLDAEEHLLVLSAPCDEWSCQVLLRELCASYAGGEATPSTPVGRERRLAHWRAALDGVPPVLELPTDRVRPRVRTHRGGVARRVLPADIGTALRDLAARHATTVSTAVLTAFAIVLHRHGGQDRFAIGAAFPGHPPAGPAPIPIDLGADRTFAGALDRTAGAVLGVRDNAGVPIGEIAAELGMPPDPSRHPVFQILVHDAWPSEPWELPGLRATPVELDTVTTAMDLALAVADEPGPVTLALTYARDLYGQASAERLVDALSHVLTQVAAEPEVPLDRVNVLPEAEWDLVVRRCNDTAAPYPSDRCLHELFEDWARRTPDATAVVGATGKAVSYGELDARANRLAHHLRGLGVGPEVFVGICVEHSVEMLVGLFGILKAGGAYVPLDPEHPADRLGYLLADTGAGVVVTLERLRDFLPESYAGRVLCLDADWPEIAMSPATAVDSGVTAQNLVYAMYTSGSTGNPKGVLISHRGLNNYLWWAIDGYGLAAGSGAPMVGSIAFDLSVPNFFLPLIGGKAVRLLPVEDRVEALAELLAAPGDFSLLKITPGHLDVLRGLLAGRWVDSVGTFVVGADEVRPETVVGWQRIAPNARIIDEYGPTETVVGCSVYPVGADFDPSVPVPIGKPIANIRMYVLDERLMPAPVGVVGELYIGGDGVARGYLGRPDLTADRFLPDPFASEPGARFYRSGDLARRRADGNIEFLGRIDHQVKINGYRIELGEIEARLLAHPSVSEAVVVARVAPSGQKRLIAYTVPGLVPGSVDLAQWLSRALPAYMVPARFVTLDRMPLTPAGKVDRDALPDPGRPAGSRRRS